MWLLWSPLEGRGGSKVKGRDLHFSYESVWACQVEVGFFSWILRDLTLVSRSEKGNFGGVFSIFPHLTRLTAQESLPLQLVYINAHSSQNLYNFTCIMSIMEAHNSSQSQLERFVPTQPRVRASLSCSIGLVV